MVKGLPKLAASRAQRDGSKVAEKSGLFPAIIPGRICKGG